MPGRHFSDLDGHLWEVAYNPQFPLRDDGRPATAGLSSAIPKSFTAAVFRG
jgi:hypothetical protein